MAFLTSAFLFALGARLENRLAKARGHRLLVTVYSEAKMPLGRGMQVPAGEEPSSSFVPRQASEFRQGELDSCGEPRGATQTTTLCQSG